MNNNGFLENRTFDEIEVGETASLSKTLTENDVALFAALTGDIDPNYIDEDPREGVQSRVIGHSLWSGNLVATVLSTQLPGPGTIFIGQALRFVGPIGPGDTITVTLTAEDKTPSDRSVKFGCRAVNHLDQPVLEGTVEVIAPAEKIRRSREELPEFVLQQHRGFDRLMALCESIEPIPTAIAHPCDESSLSAVVDAAAQGIIVPKVVAPLAKVRDVAEQFGLDLSDCTLIDAEHSHESAAKAVELVRAGEAEILMKGSLHTDELMGAVVSKSHGLRTERRISHAFIMTVPTQPDLLIVTDGAINIQPDLEAKRDICQNAIDLAHALGIEQPRVAILSAVETVTTRIPSTQDAASLCKMADRGQIAGALLDGPLAFDNAISKEAARIKGIKSAVAGQPHILVVPDLESGNILAKQLTFMAKADAAGVVLGARVPIILTSRADNHRTKLASCAVAAIMAYRRRGQVPGKILKGVGT
ncbi:MAG: bifunctional enoyl-CoA hydratase/phosphate acetyltransferase [Alphaproteobacteria bacterium]|jgi:phosphotransacetylase/acyl dehydratase|nr:bifunctional enoyl-CoA hydratase/phosphate acetyltransferase [Alphaproteobacteria bacterium]